MYLGYFFLVSGRGLKRPNSSGRRPAAYAVPLKNDTHTFSFNPRRWCGSCLPLFIIVINEGIGNTAGECVVVYQLDGVGGKLCYRNTIAAVTAIPATSAIMSAFVFSLWCSE
jgi:hypothetical protein